MTDHKLRLITPEARLSFPALFRPARPIAEGRDSKYQCELIFAQGTDLSELTDAADMAARNRWGQRLPRDIRSPFRDGDTDRQGINGYAGSTFISCRSKDMPGIVTGPDRLPCDDEYAIYGGCYVKVSVTAFAYDIDGNKGISFALNNVWKLRDGQPFSSRLSAEDEFAASNIDSNACSTERSTSPLL